MTEKTTVSKYRANDTEKQKFLGRTYAWMCLALLLSAASAFCTTLFEPFVKLLWSYRGAPFFVLIIAELVLVWWLSASLAKISVTQAAVAFIVYSIIDGITLSSIFWVYHLSSIVWCFVSCAFMFLAMSVYGMKTKTNLAPVARYLVMLLIGIIIVSTINLIIGAVTGQPSGLIDWIISLVSIVVFTGLTAYDSQKILKTAERATDADDYKKLALMGALELYLDFINLFLSLLRFFGKRN